jgi:hypothetical protein
MWIMGKNFKFQSSVPFSNEVPTVDAAFLYFISLKLHSKIKL